MVLHVLKLLVGEKEHQLGPEAAQNQEHVPNGKKLASLAWAHVAETRTQMHRESQDSGAAQLPHC